MVDVRTLPRLEGAVEDAARTNPTRLSYGVPTVVAVTTPATRNLLAADGWVQYVRPLEESSSLALVQEGTAGAVCVALRKASGRPDQSVVYYTADRIYAERAVSGGCDRHRVRRHGGPISAASRAATVDASLDFFRKELAALGLVAALGGRYRRALAERQTRRDHRERRARLFQP